MTYFIFGNGKNRKQTWFKKDLAVNNWIQKSSVSNCWFFFMSYTVFLPIKKRKEKKKKKKNPNPQPTEFSIKPASSFASSWKKSYMVHCQTHVSLQRWRQVIWLRKSDQHRGILCSSSDPTWDNLWPWTNKYLACLVPPLPENWASYVSLF